MQPQLARRQEPKTRPASYRRGDSSNNNISGLGAGKNEPKPEEKCGSSSSAAQHITGYIDHTFH